MSRELFTAFVIFALVSLFTPGPNNLMLMTSGVNHGFRRTLPHALGVAFGFGFLVLLVGLGLGVVFAAFPPLYTVLKFAGAAYLVYLAWLIARSGPAGTGGTGGRPLTFLEAAAFQWVNAKALVMAVGAVSTYAAVAAFPANIGLITGVFTTLGLLSSSTWILFGTSLRAIITDPKRARAFNLAMAVALVASIVPVFWEAGPAGAATSGTT
jgi:threonine/homoserine/homoserine lactone efflux protein